MAPPNIVTQFWDIRAELKQVSSRRVIHSELYTAQFIIGLAVVDLQKRKCFLFGTALGRSRIRGDTRFLPSEDFNAQAAGTRPLRSLEHHSAEGLQLAGRKAARLLYRLQRGALRFSYGPRRGPGPPARSKHPQLRVARLWQSRRPVAFVRDVG